MTSAAPLCGVDFVFKRERREKRAQRRSCLKGLQRLQRFGLTKIYVWVSFEIVILFNWRKLCTLKIVPLILPVFWIVDFQLKERLISPINRKVFVYDCTYAYSQDRTLSRSNASTGSYNSPAAQFSKKTIAEKK